MRSLKAKGLSLGPVNKGEVCESTSWMSWVQGSCPLLQVTPEYPGPAQPQRPGRKGSPNLTPLQESPPPTSMAGLPSDKLCWDVGSRDRKVPSSDTWDFSVSLSMPGSGGGWV